jgi:hypothetical protein
VRLLYAGSITDSLEVAWDGRSTSGALPAPGHYVLDVRSGNAPEPAAHVVRIPLEITWVSADSVDRAGSPAGSAAAAARPALGAPWHSLALGALAAAAAVALPAIVSRGGGATPARLPVAAAVGAAGVVGFFRPRPGQRPALTAPQPGGGPARPTTPTAATLIIHAGAASVFGPGAP